jgi:hypothetical protein
MMFRRVLDLAADKIPVAVTCRVLGFSNQAFYKWKANPVTQRDWDDAHLVNAAIDIHHDDQEFGYRFISDQLLERGLTGSRNRKPGPPVHDDLVVRVFRAQQPNQLWLTEIAEHPTGELQRYRESGPS